MPAFNLGLGLQHAGLGTDADALSFFTRASITNPTQKTAVNQLVNNLKGAGLWTRASAIYPFVGGTAASHAINLKNASLPITWVNAPTHDANGVTGNGTTASGTIAAPNAIFSLNSAHGVVYNRTALPTAGGAFFGAVQTTTTRGDVIVAENTAGFILSNMNDTSFSGGTGIQRASGISRVDAANVHVLAGGVTSPFANASTLVPALVNLLLFARSFEGFANDKYNNANLAYASFGLSLTPAQLITYASIIQTYQTALGRQV